jgi:hypothetical protein
MDTQELEQVLEDIQAYIDGRAKSVRDKHFWEGRRDAYEKLLKERAEAGVY